MKLTTSLTLATLMMFASASLVPAQTAMPGSTASKPSTVAAKPAAPMEKTAKSKECSAQADAKGLHGKARKKFRSQCKAGKS
jgi:hypothetical protein